MKEALTETLVRKMRAAFAGDGDTLAEDIVGEEVVAFMTNNGSTRDSEIAALEARIAARLEAERGADAVEFCVDSTYAINTARGRWCTKGKNRELARRLRAASCCRSSKRANAR